MNFFYQLRTSRLIAFVKFIARLIIQSNEELCRFCYTNFAISETIQTKNKNEVQLRKKKQHFEYKHEFHADLNFKINLNSKSCKPERGDIITDLCKRTY